MKKSQLKKALKPLIKDCIKEVLLEEGILSKIIFEVVKGTQPSLPPQSTLRLEQKESFTGNTKKQELLEQKWEKDKERRKKLLDATGFKDVNVFEGVEPMTTSGESKQAAAGPLTGIGHNDSGVDISGIMALGADRWKHLIK